MSGAIESADRRDDTMGTAEDEWPLKRTITDRIDAITGIRDIQRDPAPPCPHSVKIELTARCNFACAFCATATKLRDKGDMSWEFYSERLLPMLKKAGVKEVGMFFLGESFLVSWLPKAIARAKHLGFEYVFLTTNGSLATPARVEECMLAGLDSLKFSLNYADAAQFASIARVKSSLFDKMVENVEGAFRIRQSGEYDCGLFASYIAYDGAQGERMTALMQALQPYLDEIYALPLYSQADLVGDEQEKRKWQTRAGNPGRADNMRAPVPCWSIFTEARVKYDGHLSACCFDHDGRFDMGDLNKFEFMELWHSPGFKALRSAHLANDLLGGPCEKCVAYS